VPPPPAGAPTGCIATAAPTALASAGGAVAIAATCSGTVTSWAWTRNGATFGTAAASQSDALPANATASAVYYTYAVTACNGTACAAAVSVTVSVAGSSTPPPPPGQIACAGFARTVVIDLPWASTTAASRVLTSSYGGFGANDALVVKLTVPAGVVSFSPGSINMAEWGTGGNPRYASLSTTACDFSTTNWFSDLWASGTISTPLYVGVPAPAYAGASLQAGQVYYLNIRNTDRWGNPSCSEPSGYCNMFIDFYKPPGT
jgi:hypothetical protein